MRGDEYACWFSSPKILDYNSETGSKFDNNYIIDLSWTSARLKYIFNRDTLDRDGFSRL